jgi:hypothetical protein
MPRMRTLLVLSLVLAGCSSSNNNTTPPAVDAAVTPDAPAVALTCTNYCNLIVGTATTTGACTGTLAQYGGTTLADAMAHCMGTCAAFPTSAVQSGDTLGCHIYHTMNAAMPGNAATHCPHAGPGGDAIGSAGVCGDPCTNFCTLVQTTCTGANAAYADMGTCMTACAGFSTTAKYTVDTTTFPSTNPTGNTLACRLYHATNAAVSTAAAGTHCAHTKVTSATCM